MGNNSENTTIFYPDLEEYSSPEPGHAEGMTLKVYECPTRDSFSKEKLGNDDPHFP